MLFEVEVPDHGTDEVSGPVECTECHRPLHSEQSKAARVGPGCAAKTGRAVISYRMSKRARRRQAPDAA